MKLFILGMRYAAKLARDKDKRHSHIADSILQEAMRVEMAGRGSIFWKKAKEFIG